MERKHKKNSLRWKWRFAIVGGPFVECAEEYNVFFECVRAARARGYEPRPRWTGPCVLARQAA